MMIVPSSQSVTQYVDVEPPQNYTLPSSITTANGWGMGYDRTYNNFIDFTISSNGAYPYFQYCEVIELNDKGDWIKEGTNDNLFSMMIPSGVRVLECGKSTLLTYDNSLSEENRFKITNDPVEGTGKIIIRSSYDEDDFKGWLGTNKPKILYVREKPIMSVI